MMKMMDAIYENGALKLQEPLDLGEKARVRVLVRAARESIGGELRDPPPGAGAFESGYSDTAERAEELLGEMGFGEDRG